MERAGTDGASTQLGVPRGATRELLAAQSAILARAAGGAELPELLEQICRMIEDPVAHTTCTILLVDGPVVRHGAAPGMPAAFTEAIDGEAWGPDRGSCGTSVHTGLPTIVEDIATDHRWEPWRPLALALGFLACWSVPVLGPDGDVVATFAAYATERRSPTPDELELLEHAAHLVAVLLEQARARAELQALAGQLVEVNRSLAAASRAKDDFLSMTSHELRTPLTPMIGMIETLRARYHSFDDEARLGVLEVVERQARRLHGLLDDLLTMSAATAGRIDPQPSRVAVDAACARAVAGVALEDDRVEVAVAPGLVAHVDPRHLQQMLENYLTNAHKYAPGAVVRVEGRRVGDEVELRVCDGGDGIDPALVGRLFEPFSQLDAGDRRTSTGTGLGLAVVRTLARANGGRAWYEPAPGGGACFAVALPVAADEEPSGA